MIICIFAMESIRYDNEKVLFHGHHPFPCTGRRRGIGQPRGGFTHDYPEVSGLLLLGNPPFVISSAVGRSKKNQKCLRIRDFAVYLQSQNASGG